MSRWALLLGALNALGACGPHVDPAFALEADRAGALHAAGRYREAGEHWLTAARAAGSAVDRDEATYRAATSFARAGDAKRAESLLGTLATGQGERAARAAFDRARSVEASDPARAQTLRLEALRDHPGSGVAGEAARDYLARIEGDTGQSSALERCRSLRSELEKTELDEVLGYECARRAEAAGALARARDDYLLTADRHPYPKGAYWDDALTAAARCEEQLGHPARAVELLERLLAEREPAHGVGSYERASYDAARFHIAELYRDALGDPARARREFRRVFSEHTTSRLRDDALLEEASLAELAHDRGATCDALGLLRAELPDSRFADCARLLCPGAPGSPRPCAEAARERLTGLGE